MNSFDAVTFEVIATLLLLYLMFFCYHLRQEVTALWAANETRLAAHTVIRAEIEQIWEVVERPREDKTHEPPVTPVALAIDRPVLDINDDGCRSHRGGAGDASSHLTVSTLGVPDFVRMPLHLVRSLYTGEGAPLGEDIVPPLWLLGARDAEAIIAQTDLRDRRDDIPRHGIPRPP